MAPVVGEGNGRAADPPNGGGPMSGGAAGGAGMDGARGTVGCGTGAMLGRTGATPVVGLGTPGSLPVRPGAVAAPVWGSTRTLAAKLWVLAYKRIASLMR